MKMNINMKKIVFFLLVQFVTLGAFAQEATIKEAEVAYTKEDYGKAIELYEGLLKTHGESAEIYYNLGNAYYKENKIAPAILNYERRRACRHSLSGRFAEAWLRRIWSVPTCCPSAQIV